MLKYISKNHTILLLSQQKVESKNLRVSTLHLKFYSCSADKLDSKGISWVAEPLQNEFEVRLSVAFSVV